MLKNEADRHGELDSSGYSARRMKENSAWLNNIQNWTGLSGCRLLLAIEDRSK